MTNLGPDHDWPFVVTAVLWWRWSWRLPSSPVLWAPWRTGHHWAWTPPPWSWLLSSPSAPATSDGPWQDLRKKKGCEGGVGSKPQGWGIAQLVDVATQKPGTKLTQVRVPAAASDFSPRVNFQCKLSYGVCKAPVCNHMHQYLCAH